MGSSFDDGLKGSDVAEGAEGTLLRFSRHYHVPLEEPAARRSMVDVRALPKTLIERTVADSVLTELLRRHGTVHPPLAVMPDSAAPALPEHSASVPAAAEFEAFLCRLAEGDFDGALTWLKPWRHPLGLIDDMMAGLLAHAARRLGQQWEDDQLSFAEVSLGIVILQQILREFVLEASLLPQSARRMLLMSGEGHCFGVRLLGARLQQAGWDCQCESSLSEDAMLRRATNERYDVIGISVQTAESEYRAAALVARLRATSRERGVRILLGGSRFSDRPDAVIELGSDLAMMPFAALCAALDQMVPVPMA